MDKQNTVYLYLGISLRNKQVQITDAEINLNEYHKYYKCKKPDTKECILNDSICRKYQLTYGEKSEWMVAWGQGWRGKWTIKEHKDTFRVMEISCILVVVEVSWVRTHQI